MKIELETERQANTDKITEIETAIKANEHANYMLLINKKRLEKGQQGNRQNNSTTSAMKLTENELKAQSIILTQIDTALIQLEEHFQKYCDEVSVSYNGTKATSVPMIYIKESFKIYKENLVKGAKYGNKEH